VARLRGGRASLGACAVGTAGCDGWMDLLGVLKLDKACDPTMMQQCSRVMWWGRGGILPEIMLFVMCAAGTRRVFIWVEGLEFYV